KLIKATASYQDRQEEQDRLEDKLDQLEQDVAVKTKELKAARHKLDMMTDALIELSREPPLGWFLRSGLTRDYIHRSILLRAVLPQLK
ncbi:hypothetical protein, partial [Parvimonas micra]|uniref:hypothetical protein n=1 Tax=Parvimonas micra TaxID=33033 RepID=UPI002B49FF6D